jgi:heme-degrading monooxygenase HmoA
MVTVGLHYDVKPGREAEFEERFRDVRAALSAAPGHRWSRLFRDVDNPLSYLVYSEWDSRDAFMDFVRSDAFRATTAWAREEVLAAQPRHRVFEL